MLLAFVLIGLRDDQIMLLHAHNRAYTMAVQS